MATAASEIPEETEAESETRLAEGTVKSERSSTEEKVENHRPKDPREVHDGKQGRPNPRWGEHGNRKTNDFRLQAPRGSADHLTPYFIGTPFPLAPSAPVPLAPATTCPARLGCIHPLILAVVHSPTDMAVMWEKKNAEANAVLAKAEAFQNRALGTVSPTIAVYHAREKEAPVYSETPGPFGENLTGPHDPFEEGERRTKVHESIDLNSDGSVHEDHCHAVHPKVSSRR